MTQISETTSTYCKKGRQQGLEMSQYCLIVVIGNNECHRCFHCLESHLHNKQTYGH